ncbi:LLM class F420-dependent oxidoreductase [Jatrophihabitans fulvus]
MNTDEGLNPLELAREAEALGIESVFLPDHSHVPVRRSADYGGPRGIFPDSPGDMPREYYRNLDQLITLAAMGAVTSTLRLGTGVCLVVQRDPIQLAKELASIDHLSGGRLVFGVGGGAPWNEEEMRHHGTDPRTRFSLMRERVHAIKTIWSDEQAEFHGARVDFDPIFSWPKPVQKPGPPILLGGHGEKVFDRVLDYGDGWMPGHLESGGHDDIHNLGDRIAELRERGRAVGRDHVHVTVYLGRLDWTDRYREMSADRVVYVLPSGPPDLTRQALREVAAAAADDE